MNKGILTTKEDLKMGEKGLKKGVLEDYGWSRLKSKGGTGQTDWERDIVDPARAFNPTTGQNAYWDPDKGQWTDSKTGDALTPPVYE
jgi:hypothetical protein